MEAESTAGRTPPASPVNKCRVCKEDLDGGSYNNGLCGGCACVGGGGLSDMQESTAGRGRCLNMTVNEDGVEVRCNAECSPSSQLCHDCRQQSLHAFWADAHAL